MSSYDVMERNNRFYILTSNQLYLLVGFMLIALYFTQLNLNLKWEWLADLQSNEFYRQFTGFLLLVYVLMQGRLGMQRLSKSSSQYRTLFAQHKLHGVYGPIIFYIHSIDIGFAYQVVLTFVFLGNSLVGYLSPQAIKVRDRWYVLSWIILHISLAILTLVLMIFHIYIVYYYS